MAWLYLNNMDRMRPGRSIEPLWRFHPRYYFEMTIKLVRSVKFASAPAPEGPFTRVAPTNFKVADLTGFGVDTANLPKPAIGADSE